MQPIRVGYVRYLNTLPLVTGLDKLDGLEPIPAAPSHLVGLLERGEADVSLVSLIDAARTPGLVLLPVGMIGCDGPTLTVRVFSRVPIDKVTRVHVDAESHTSGVLCRVVLHMLHGLSPEFVEYNAREHVTPAEPDGAEPPETILLIGDKVVTDPPPEGDYPHTIDLGQAWHEQTGLPFVYAVWMCRGDDAGTPAIATASGMLDRLRRRNRERLGWIVRTRAAAFGWPEDLALHYLRDRLRFAVDARAREGAELFVRTAAELGVVPEASLAWGDAVHA